MNRRRTVESADSILILRYHTGYDTIKGQEVLDGIYPRSRIKGKSLCSGSAKRGARLNDIRVLNGTDKIEIRDADGQLSWRLKLPCQQEVWHFPVMTVSQSEKAYELNYQSSAVMPIFRTELKVGEELELIMKVEILHGT